MKLIKTRPEVRLYLPGSARPGERIVARVVLDARRPVPVDRVTCRLEGHESITVGSGKSKRSQSRTVTALGAELLEATELAEGETVLRCRFDLPPDLPASYEGRHAQVRYLVSVDVEIPWWLDKRSRFQLVVGELPVDVDDPGPSLHATAPEGPSGREPQLELSLESTVLHGGETLHGRLALLNTAYNPYETATLALVGHETVFGVRREARRYGMRLSVKGSSEGDAIPFAMKLPERLSPTAASVLWRLDWVLEVTVDYGWRRSFEAVVPLTLLPEGSTRRQRERRAPRIIGSGRVRAIWEAVARAEGLAFDAEADIIRGRDVDTLITVRREHRGQDGLFLVGELAFARLGLDLDGGEASSLRRIVGGGVRLGHPDWDRNHYLTGRDEVQIASFVGPLSTLLLPLTLADVHDDAMVLTRRDAGQSADKLARFVREVKAVAAALPHARAAIVAPVVLAAGEASWLVLARRLGGSLDRATMAVSGRIDDIPVTIGTAWAPSGEPLHTEITVKPPFDVDERHELSWTRGGFGLGDPSQLARGAQGLLPKVLEGAMSLTVARDVLALWLPAPVFDAETLLARAEELIAFGAALEGDRGPYR